MPSTTRDRPARRSEARERLLATASQAILGRTITYSEAALTEIMSPAHFVKVRTTWGGPAPSEISRAIGESRNVLSADRSQWQQRHEHLDRSEATLKQRVKAL